MDWVDYKRHVVSKYRGVYKSIHPFCVSCLASAIFHYTEYRNKGLEDVAEWKLIREYGQCLFYVAQIELLTATLPSHRVKSMVDWKMTNNAIDIIHKSYNGEIGEEEALILCASWVRSYYTFLSLSRIFEVAMEDNRKFLIDKFGY